MNSNINLSVVGHILDTPYSIGPDVNKHNINFNISCRYSWKRDGVIIKHQYIRFNPLTGMLTIPKFTVRENGIYTCIAMNTINGKEVKAMSPNVKLILQRKSEPNTHTHTHTHTHCRLSLISVSLVVSMLTFSAISYVYVYFLQSLRSGT